MKRPVTLYHRAHIFSTNSCFFPKIHDIDSHMGGGIRVKDALTLGGVQDDLAAVAVFQEIFAHLGDARDVQRAGDDGRMALAAALGGDEAEDAARRDAEQIGGHEQVRRKDDRVVEGQPAAEPVAEDVGERHSVLMNLKEKCDAPECNPTVCRKARDAHEL